MAFSRSTVSLKTNQLSGRHKENAMQQFIEKYREQILGTLSSFDRLVFRGSLRSLHIHQRDHSRQVLVARGMEEYLWRNQILFKHYGQHVKRVAWQPSTESATGRYAPSAPWNRARRLTTSSRG